MSVGCVAHVYRAPLAGQQAAQAHDSTALLALGTAAQFGTGMVLHIVIPAAVAAAVLVAAVCVVVYLRRSMPPCADTGLQGRVVVVTGANSGLGYQCALQLARRGARVLLACRSEERGLEACDAMVRASGNPLVEWRPLDLASLASVREFAARLRREEPALHVLVNNAGVYGCTEPTRDDLHETMQVNYFGHFLLTILLLPLLKASQPARIVNLSSILHFLGDFNEKTINSGSKMRSYCNSKFCMLVFTMELARRLEGSGVVANAVHPGVILTSITSKRGATAVTGLLFRLWCALYGRGEAAGARCAVHLAACPAGARLSGHYVVDGRPRVHSPRAWSRDKALRLWNYSLEVVGCTDLTVAVPTDTA